MSPCAERVATIAGPPPTRILLATLLIAVADCALAACAGSTVAPEAGGGSTVVAGSDSGGSRPSDAGSNSAGPSDGGQPLDGGGDPGDGGHPPYDGGDLDAGPQDAGELPWDGGERDAGPEPSDGGPFDAGAQDGGPAPVDAGPLSVDAGPLVRTGRMPIPAYGGVTPDEPWLDGMKLVVRDLTPGSAGDLVALPWLAGALVPYVSTDLGSTWAYLGPGATCAHDAPRSLAQDASGAIHLVSSVAAVGRVEYSRVRLLHESAGHVAGLAVEVDSEPIAAVNGNMDVNVELALGRAVGGPALVFVAVMDDPASAVRNRIQLVRTSIAAGLQPRARHPEDWSALDGTPGTTEVALGDALLEATSSHVVTVGLTQHPHSLDLLLFVGMRETGDGVAPSPGIRRFRFVPSGPASWAQAGAATLLAGDGAFPPTWGTAMAGADDVWYALFDSARGLTIGRVGANGAELAPGIPSPDPRPDLNGWAALSVDATGTRLWTIWVRRQVSQWPAPASESSFSAHWDGAAWDVVDETSTGPYVHPAGIAGVARWDDGLAAMISESATQVCTPPRSPSIHVIRGGR